jgi:hypothetical protein
MANNGTKGDDKMQKKIVCLGGGGYYIRTSNNTIHAVIGDGKGKYNAVWFGFKWDNNFHHVAMVISGKNLTIY